MEHDFKVIELTTENILSFDSFLPYDMSGRIQWPAHYGLGLVDGNRPCGAMMMIFDTDDLSLTAYYLFVEEKDRGDGGGKLLIAEMEALAGRIGAERAGIRYSLPGDEAYTGMLEKLGYQDIEEESESHCIKGIVLKNYIEEQKKNEKSLFRRGVERHKKYGKAEIIMMSDATPQMKRLWEKGFDKDYPTWLAPVFTTGEVDEKCSVFLVDAPDVVGFAYVCKFEDGTRHLAGVYFPPKYSFDGIPMIMTCLLQLANVIQDDEEFFLTTINKMSRDMVAEFMSGDLKENAVTEQTLEAFKTVGV